MITQNNNPTKFNLIKEAQDAFSLLLSQVQWQTFCTFTYKTNIYATEKIQRDLVTSIRKATAMTLELNEKSKSFKRAFNRGEYAPWFIAIEKHKSGSFHAHALVGSQATPCVDGTAMRTISTPYLKHTFSQRKDAGFTKMVPVRTNTKAVNYMIKTSRYCTKSHDAILDWNGLKDWNECHDARSTLSNNEQELTLSNL